VLAECRVVVMQRSGEFCAWIVVKRQDLGYAVFFLNTHKHTQAHTYTHTNIHTFICLPNYRVKI
jgi:hypothetical protein